MVISLKHILTQLPTENKTNFRIQNRELFEKLNKTCVVVDDDPTGNQTVYDVPLLTEWDVDTIANEFRKKTPVFFLLTNSRSLSVEESTKIYSEIAKNIKEASIITHRNFSIISRSDSTLRGHFPSEIDAIINAGNFDDAITVFIPVMFEGGRVTLNDIHYVNDGNDLIPVNETPFAKDHTFGYSKANLKEWIEEKTMGKIKASTVFSFSIEEIRTFSIEELSDRIIAIPLKKYCVFNALGYNDLDKVSNALLLAEKVGKQIIYRTSSSFVPSYIGLSKKALLNAIELIEKDSKIGGLTMVGSYVSKSSTQLNNALKCFNKDAIIEIDVSKILSVKDESYLNNSIQKINNELAKGENVLVFTSRNLIAGKTNKENINIGKTVSNALIQIVQKLTIRPKYVIAKGGITSHDLALKGLGMKRSKVLGQILPGIPVWEMGNETKFSKLPYIVFPGNVGDDQSLLTIIQKLT